MAAYLGPCTEALGGLSLAPPRSQSFPRGSLEEMAAWEGKRLARGHTVTEGHGRGPHRGLGVPQARCGVWPLRPEPGWSWQQPDTPSCPISQREAEEMGALRNRGGGLGPRESVRGHIPPGGGEAREASQRAWGTDHRRPLAQIRAPASPGAWSGAEVTSPVRAGQRSTHCVPGPEGADQNSTRPGPPGQRGTAATQLGTPTLRAAACPRLC